MGVIINGPRKAGNHALRYVVRALGYKNREGGLFEKGIYIPADKTKHYGEPLSQKILEEELEDDEVFGAHKPDLKSKHKIITILRDPMDIALSFYRANKNQNLGGISRDGFFRFIIEHNKFYNLTIPFWDLLEREDILVVWYEHLFHEDTINRIKQYLDKQDVEFNKDKAYGHGPTWTGSPSDWRTHDLIDISVLKEFWKRWNFKMYRYRLKKYEREK